MVCAISGWDVCMPAWAAPARVICSWYTLYCMYLIYLIAFLWDVGIVCCVSYIIVLGQCVVGMLKIVMIIVHSFTSVKQKKILCADYLITYRYILPLLIFLITCHDNLQFCNNAINLRNFYIKLYKYI